MPVLTRTCDFRHTGRATHHAEQQNASMQEIAHAASHITEQVDELMNLVKTFRY